MNIPHLKHKFGLLGARLKVIHSDPPRSWARPITIDVRSDRKGEYFEVLVNSSSVADLEVMDVRTQDRHLLLLARDSSSRRVEISRFLCGRDERHWLVAATPSGSTVAQAKESLKPVEVKDSQEIVHLKATKLNCRKNAAFIRQGEWFFIPCQDLEVDPRLVLHSEPIRRGRGKPHRVQYLYRRGGMTVYVCSVFPTGLTQSEYRALLGRSPDKRGLDWHTMVRDPEAFAKGAVRHPDHKTIHLKHWHRIALNREADASGAGNVAFLD
jgi:hypothetical protein